MPRTQRQRSESTTAELIEAARSLFAAHGFTGTSLDDVVAAAGVTKGALYHHFGSKQELFRAVFEREQQALADAIDRAFMRRRDPWQGFFAGCRAFFDASLDRGVQRITLVDCTAVLGYEEVRAIQSRYTLDRIKLGLRIAIDHGYVDKRPVDPLAHLIFGAICEGAMTVARADDPAAQSRRVLRELKALLGGLSSR